MHLHFRGEIPCRTACLTNSSCLGYSTNNETGKCQFGHLKENFAFPGSQKKVHIKYEAIPQRGLLLLGFVNIKIIIKKMLSFLLIFVYTFPVFLAFLINILQYSNTIY